MAEQGIVFRIGSKFSGEGFRKAQQQTLALNRTVKSSVGQMGALASAFGGLDQSCAQSMGAIADMMGNLVTLNLTGIAAQGVMFALSKYIDDLNRRLEEAKSRTEALKAATSAAFSNELSRQFSDAASEASNLVSEFDRITKSANSFNAAISGIKSAEGQGSILDLQMRKLQATVDAAAWGGEKTVAAEYDLAIAKEKARQLQERANDSLEKAEKDRSDSAARLSELEKARDSLIEKRCELEGSLAVAEGDERTKINATLKRLQAEEEKYTAQIKSALDAEAELEAKVEKAKVERVNAEKQGALDVKTADARLAELKRQEADAQKKRLEEAEKANEVELERQLSDATKGLTDSRNEVKEAEAAYRTALDEYRKNLHKNVANDEANAASANDIRTSGGGSLPSGWAYGHQSQASQRRAADMAVAKGLEDGSIRNSRQYADAQKAAARAQRDWESSREALQERRDARDLERLEKMSDKRLSPSDRKRRDALRETKNAKDRAGKELADAEKRKNDAAEAEEQAQKDIGEIKSILKEKLGLK